MRERVVYTRPLVLGLRELADGEFQNASWPDPATYSSPWEVFEDTFGNSGLDEDLLDGGPEDIRLDHGEPAALDMAPRPRLERLTPAILEDLVRLDALMDRLCDMTLSRILTSRELVEVREVAGRVLTAFGIPGPHR